MYSVTKAVAATAIHVSSIGLLPTTPAPLHWPEYRAHGKDRTTVRDVLTHRARVPQIRAAARAPGRLGLDDTSFQEVQPPVEPAMMMYPEMTFG